MIAERMKSTASLRKTTTMLIFFQFLFFSWNCNGFQHHWGYVGRRFCHGSNHQCINPHLVSATVVMMAEGCDHSHSNSHDHGGGGEAVEDELETLVRKLREEEKNDPSPRDRAEERVEAQRRRQEWIDERDRMIKRDKNELQALMKTILATQDTSHVPSILSKHIELILRISEEGYGANITQSILEDTANELATDGGGGGGVVDDDDDDDPDAAIERAEMTLDMIFTFAEDFVNQAVELDKQNKNTIGKIIQTMTDKTKTTSDREYALDALLRDERENLTPGFIRHIDNECERIQNAPEGTNDSKRLLEVLRVIQRRVLEELAKEDLGEAAQVLGQLIGYTDHDERIAVLEAGLMVRGIEFAQEMHRLTKEALDGFKRVGPDKADPSLINMIGEIDMKLTKFIQDEEEGSYQ